MVKNLPANAGDMGMISGLGRDTVEQLSPCTPTIELVLQSLGLIIAKAHEP